MSASDYVTAKQMAERLDVDVDAVREALRCGHISAKKQNGRWTINPKTATRFIEKNERAVRKLKEEIIAEYWQGYTLPRLQERAHGKKLERHILVKDRHIAEQTIYQHLMKSRGGLCLPPRNHKSCGGDADDTH